MAYYSSNFHESDLGEYEPNPYGGGYDFAPPQPLMAYSSSYEFSEPKFFEYDQTPYYGAYDPALTRSIVSYSSSTFSEPNFVQYHPYNPSQTQFLISYSTSDSIEPEFIDEDPDPIPYIGGYDIALTYGRPLPPSDEICYPRSMPDPNAISLNGFSYGSIASPYGKEEVDEYKAKPRNGIKPTRANDEPENQSHGSHLGELVENSNGEERGGTYCDEYYPWSGYEYEKHVPQTQCGYGSDAMDLCESIFGYWPCLSRKDQKNNGCQQVDDEESNCNHWKGTEDYLFGSSYPYGDSRDGSSHGDPIYGYERHYYYKG